MLFMKILLLIQFKQFGGETNKNHTTPTRKEWRRPGDNATFTRAGFDMCGGRVRAKNGASAVDLNINVDEYNRVFNLFNA